MQILRVAHTSFEPASGGGGASGDEAEATTVVARDGTYIRKRTERCNTRIRYDNVSR